MFLDLTKAFDCVDHQILLAKLSSYGFSNNAKLWFQSYLTNRWQSVSHNNQSSEFGEVKLGVPQCSILGPLLFSIYINDLPTILKQCDIYLYADDAVFFCNHHSLESLNRLIQEDMNNIVRWMLSNRLKLNIKKSCAMLIGSPQKIKELRLDISILGEPLMNVTKTKYLGVVVDNHLKWKEHISYLKQLIMFKIICLKRLLPLPKSTIMLLYRTYILPILDYCDCVWSCASATLLKSLDRIHYRFFKLVDRTEVPSTNSLPPSLILNNRRVFHVVLQTYKILKRICPNYLCDLVRFSRDVTSKNSKNT